MASWAPAACMCWAMAQAMLRLLATPNTTTVRPSMLIGIRESSSASAIELIGSIFKDISLKVGCLGGVVPPYGDRILWMARDPALTRVLRNAAVPPALRRVFPLYPVLRLRLRTGLDYGVPFAPGNRDLFFPP